MMITKLFLLSAYADALRVADVRVQAKPVMKLRGGIAGVDPTVLAKTFYTLAIANVAFVTMAPEKAAKKICDIDVSPIGAVVVENIGVQFACGIIMALCALNGVDVGKAVAWGMVPNIYTKTRDCINGKYTSLGLPLSPMYSMLAFNTALAAVSYHNSGIAGNKGTLAMLAIATLNALTGIVMYAAPHAAVHVQGMGTVTATESIEGLVRYEGGAFLSNAVFVASLALGKSAVDSIAYAISLQMVAGPLTAFFVSDLFPEEKKGLILAWAALSMLCVPIFLGRF